MRNIIFICLLQLLIACGSENTNQQKPEKLSVKEEFISLTPEQLKNCAIQIGRLDSQVVSSVIRVNGKIDVPPQNMVSVSVPLGGYLKSTKLLPGMHVHKGEVIGNMEDQQYIQLQQDYLTTKTKLAYAEAEFKRQRDLNIEKASSDKVYQFAKMEYENLRIQLGAYSEKLRLININPSSLNETNLSRSINILSPINGYVSKVLVNIGKYVNPTDVLFELVNPDDIHLNLKVFEKDLEYLAVGQTVIAYTNSNPQKRHLCEVILISHDVDEDRSTEVHCHFENYDRTLYPGVFMNAEIELTNIKLAVLPEDALVRFDGKYYVFVEIKDNTFEMVNVIPGKQEKGFVEITNAGILTGKPIVTSNAYNLLMAMKNQAEEE